jgi:hypothetical protein
MSEDLSSYAEDAAPTIGDNAGAALDHLVDRLAEADELVAISERELAEAKARAERIRSKDLPEAMDELGTSEWKSTTSGLKVVVEEKVLAAPKKEDRPTVISWLEEQGHSGLIKRELTVPFGRGEDQEEKAGALASQLEEQGLSPVFQKSVHTQTFAAWVREQLAEGIEIPLDLFGVRKIRRAKFKK